MRRRRSHDGVSWKPPTVQDPKTGLYCRRCSSRHSYNGSGKMKLVYGLDKEKLTAAWICPKTGDVLGWLL